jgi:hypothetical protein
MITFERILDEIENSMTTKADLAKCPPFNNRGSRFILNDSMDGIEQSAPPTSRYAETYAKESTHAEAAETTVSFVPSSIEFAAVLMEIVIAPHSAHRLRELRRDAARRWHPDLIAGDARGSTLLAQANARIDEAMRRLRVSGANKRL